MREARVATVASLGAVAIIAQQIASKATRDTLFLTSFDATELPQVMLGAAGLALVGVVVLSRLSAVIGPSRLVPSLFLISAALFTVEAALQRTQPETVAYLLYLHVALFGAAVISGFWSVINERFDPHSAKRYIGRIALGATAGGVVGGLSAERVAALFGPGRVLVLLAGLNVLCALIIAWVARGMAPVRKEQTQSGMSVLRESPFLRRIAGAVALLALGGALLDFALKAEADRAISEPASLASFFALYYTAVGLATFLVQTFATRLSLEKLGIGISIALMPIAVVVLGAVGAAFTRIWTVVMVRGTATVLENSVYRSGYELLYTPVSPAQKRPTKLLIDVAGNRLGDAVGSGSVLLLLLVMEPNIVVPVTIGLAVVAATGALILVARLQRGYVSQLARSLRSGALFLDDDLAVDATTRRTLAETTMALDREKLLHAIEEHRRDRHSLGDDLESTEQPALELGVADVAELLEQMGDDAMRRAASKALRQAAKRHLGQIIDTLLDVSAPLKVRRRLPPIVASTRSKRAVRGLMDALGDPRFEVRYRVGLALSALCAGSPETAPGRAEVFALAAREVQVGRKVWESQRLIEDAEEDIFGTFGEVLRERRDRSLEHVFNILSLILDRDTLRLSLQALHSGQDELRGTALEYLENVLPDDVRRGLWPYVAGQRTKRTSDRPSKEIVDDLLRSMDSLEMDRKALLEKIEKANQSD